MSSAPVAARPRVAFVTRRFGARFGGAEAYGEHLMAALRDTHDVHVFCQEWDSPLDLPHTLVPYQRRLPRWINLIDFTLRAQALTTGFDIVHSHENSWLGDVQVVHVMPVRFSRFHRRRGFWPRFSTLLSPRWLAYLTLEALRFRPRPGRSLVAASALVAQQIQQAYRVTAPCITITPGVDFPEDVIAQTVARHELGLDPALRYGVLVANDPLRKGLAAVLAAMARLPESFHLLVVGGENGVSQRVLQAVAAAGMNDRTHVWPGRRDVSRFYAAADFCVFPTLGDAFGMVPLEAMAHRLPVVLSNADYCGFARHVQSGVHAIVLDDPHDAAEVAAAVQSLLDDQARADELAQAGAELAAGFAWTTIAATYAGLYAQLKPMRLER